MKESDQTESHDATPEQLLQMLDAQRALNRSQRSNLGRNRAIILVAGLLFILIAAGAALLVLDQVLADLRPDTASPQSAEKDGRNF